ncbi:acetyl-CoA carboxylase carboxyl transferase subunit beta [Cohaesibacter sp. ES.047]|uniref:acetyl-CoA carboxylase, carboxyltransferase subunit beta n=1 Tax=Cohaesibacter sp. ES.047 TaxID=1798205 RepID=UPI000BB8BEA0|nr:acetyl-CoA carboxylase, carboxyltransferase subunit beta [Cohaesibacter sp. ES.047]SNY91735.1 acetyl-CoA carboxylase carboxyl transferase subunit beta [Cohaesibacter sp. ES.047]
MNWINTVVRPKIRSILNRRDTPENLWIKCPVTGEMVFHRDLEHNQYVVPNSDFHMRINATQRFSYFFDKNDYTLVDLPEVAVDPLKFRDVKRYSDRMKDARAKSGRRDSVVVAQGEVEGLYMTAAVQDFTFLAGSLGMAAGEALITGMMKAVADKTPFVLFTASGGARMQEGILSLMQMPRVTVAVQSLREAGLPYIVVLTDPTTGGVTASYAMLGDIQLAEPGALIGFAGQRVIEQTIREKLPEGFQRAEYLKEHGMVDMVVHRHELKSVIARLCRFFTNTPTPDPVDEDEVLLLTDETLPEAEAPEATAAEAVDTAKEADEKKETPAPDEDKKAD